MFPVSEISKNDWETTESSKTRPWLIGLFFILLASGCGQAYEGTELSGGAPDFRLTDQHGDLVSLSDFRGKVVVLTFMDSECKDTCPITAAQFREVHRQLDQNDTSLVIFLGVNVNIDASETADILRATNEWHLDEIPNWFFLTGDASALEAVWSDYGIAVVPDPESNELLHTPGVYIIDPSGEQRWYISTSFSDEESAAWVPPLSEILGNRIQQLLK